jgi:hypothetical protein
MNWRDPRIVILFAIVSGLALGPFLIWMLS